MCLVGDLFGFLRENRDIRRPFFESLFNRLVRRHVCPRKRCIICLIFRLEAIFALVDIENGRTGVASERDNVFCELSLH
jgi:hypothetical protein